MKNIVIFASGEGTNAECISQYFASSSIGKISCIICNRKKAGIYKRAERLGIPIYHFSRSQLGSEEMIQFLHERDTDLIVLAGFMCLIPQGFVKEFSGRILNIHPALLPSYGGKGMYGDHVHEAVIKAHESLSGITIHLVDEQYDHGRPLCQATCPVLPEDSIESLAARIHKLEHRFYPTTVEQYLTELDIK